MSEICVVCNNKLKSGNPMNQICILCGARYDYDFSIINKFLVSIYCGTFIFDFLVDVYNCRSRRYIRIGTYNLKSISFDDFFRLLNLRLCL